MVSRPRWPVALVTGASSGIGAVFARRLAAEGSDLVIVARRVERLDELAQELRAAHDIDVEVLPADLSDHEQLARVEQRLRDPQRWISLLINNAGYGSGGPFWKSPLEREAGQVLVNVVALHRLTHAAVGPMVERGRGAIINVSSVAGFQPIAFSATYSAGKSFVTAFSEALHEELRGTGVRIQALCPGFVHTEFQEAAGRDEPPIPDFAWLDMDVVIEASLGALRRNQALCIPGLGYKTLVHSTRLAPRGTVRRVAGALGRLRPPSK